MATNPNFTGTSFWTASNQQIVLGRQLASGGEGAVHEIQSQPNWVAKIIHPHQRSAQRSTKLLVMSQLRSKALEQLTTWPLEVLYEHQGRGGQACGFTMNYLRQSHLAHEFYDPPDRRKYFPQTCWHQMVLVAYNLARAFATVHHAGHVIGDVNQGNIMVLPDCTVRLIDIDSIQISHGRQQFLCEVGVEDYTPPELQGKRLSRIARTANHDCFGLAILIFRVLMHGKSPFSGIYTKQTLSLGEMIRRYHYAWAAKPAKGLSRPPMTVPALVASPAVAALWERAFSAVGTAPRGRPTALEWVTALTPLIQLNTRGGQLAQCQTNALHQYHNGLSACPWCALERQIPGYSPFGLPSPAQPQPRPSPPLRPSPPPSSQPSPTLLRRPLTLYLFCLLLFFIPIILLGEIGVLILFITLIFSFLFKWKIRYIFLLYFIIFLFLQ